MGIEIIDMLELAEKEKRRKNIFNTSRFHAIQIISYETREDIRQGTQA